LRPDTNPTVRLSDYAPTPYGISKVALDIRLFPGEALVTAALQLFRREGTAAGTPLGLAGDDLTLTQIAINERELAAEHYSLSDDSLTLVLPPAEPFTLTIATRLEPETNSQLSGLYRSNDIWCTQCEAEGFRRITYFLDRPDVLATYRMRIEVERAAAPVLLGNGNPVEHGLLDNNRHFAVWDDPWPKPSYLFAMVAGDLGVVNDEFITCSGRKVALGVHVEHGNEPRALYAMDALKRAMRWDEEVFGREYDLDVFNIVAVSDFNLGAMENKGLNIFNDKYVLADPDVATDSDFAGVEAVIAHEYFHNWTGNRITCRDWFQLCLKEGLTVFSDQEFSADMRSRAVKRISDVRTLRSHQFPEDGGPLSHPVRPSEYKEINNFYTATVYEKGAEVIRMLKTIIGEAAFAASMTLYFDRHDGDAATVEDFVACFAEASGRDLEPFMRWYRQAGTPTVEIAESFDPARGEYRLTFTQQVPPTPGQPDKLPHVIPVRFGLVAADGDDMAPSAISGAEAHDDVLILGEPRHEVVFSGISARPVASLFRGFSAPVKPRFSQSAADLLFLMRHDSDPFNRWQAASTLAMTMLVTGTDQARRGGRPAVDNQYLGVLGEVIADDRLDAAFRGLMLTFPGENDVAREIGQDVDPDAVHRASIALRAAAGRELRSILEKIIGDGLALSEPFRSDAAQSGQRALVNAAMDLLAYNGGAVHEMIYRRFLDATNMTDRLAALSYLVHRQAPMAEAALATFYDRFADVPLVIDKWLSVQATVAAGDTLAKVEALTNHPAFSLRNPNRTRALIGSFAQGNPTQFARSDGRGFDFVASVVMAIDASNPQLAARLLVSFRSWRSYEPGRQAKAEAALRRIAAMAGISGDVADIVERSLG
jgi:aminopeptidase N